MYVITIHKCECCLGIVHRHMSGTHSYTPTISEMSVLHMMKVDVWCVVFGWIC